MKRKFIAGFIVCGILLLTGCCTDQFSCGNVSMNYVVATPSCSSCNTCSTCGYDSSYTYSGWY